MRPFAFLAWLTLAACDAPSASDPSAPDPTPPAPRAEAAPHGPVVCGLDPRLSGPDDAALVAQARELGLDHPEAYASVVQHVRQRGELPDCYLTKREAEARGWRPGDALWTVAPGAAIGGDRFGNREGRLPRPPERYIEADLDDAGGRRNARRLVFAPDERAVWVTVDHYEHFHAAAGGRR